MKLATVRTQAGTRAVRLESDRYIDLGVADVGVLLAHEDWRELAARDGDALPRESDLAPVVPTPGKVVCVGLNYRSHIIEMGRDLPQHPTLFAKFADAIIGPHDDIVAAPESQMVDWEAELVVVIGRTVRRADRTAAAEAIAGFTVMNDVTMRDWQFRTREWLQGKTFDSTTPLGPVLVTPDELPGGVSPALTVSTTVNGTEMQSAGTADLLFTPVDLVEYVSTMITLRPGDLIATGTPAGVGHARTPQVFLAPGDKVVTEISGIGRLENTVVLG